MGLPNLRIQKCRFICIISTLLATDRFVNKPEKQKTDRVKAVGLE